MIMKTKPQRYRDWLYIPIPFSTTLQSVYFKVVLNRTQPEIQHRICPPCFMGFNGDTDLTINT